jgi:hypothetical protein
MARASHVYRLIEVLQQGPRPSEDTAFGVGNTVLTKPAGADGCAIFFDPNAPASTIAVKGTVAGDTGIVLSNNLVPVVVTCGATLNVNCSVAVRGDVRWFRVQ